MTVAYLGLGSNVGDRLDNLRAAVDLLDNSDDVVVLARSSVYEAEPVGEVLEQRDFYNAAVRIETSLEPRDLLAVCKAIEQRLGRQQDGPRHGPRPIDLDLLLVGDAELASGDLTLPHPEVAERRFVLTPLIELDPGLALPEGRLLSHCLSSLPPGQSVERIGEL